MGQKKNKKAFQSNFSDKAASIFRHEVRDDKNQAQIATSRDHYFDLYERAPVGYITVSVRGLILEANSTSAHMLGTPRSSLLKQPLSHYIHQQDLEIYYFYRRELFKARSLGSVQACELRMVKTDGSVFWAFMEATVIKNADGSVVCRIVMTNINERKLAEDKVRLINQQLQKALAERDKFFSIIAHDLRSPLMGFLVFIRMLTERIEKLSLEEIQRLAGDMKKSAENLYSLLENLLEWSIIQRGTSRYMPSCLNLAEAVRENIEMIKSCAMHKHIRFECTVPSNLHIFADRSMLNMILRNLLSNAVKFSMEKGKVSIYAAQRESMVLVSVRDQGMGMDNVTMSSLFALDQISSRKGTGGEKGTGLGLLLSKEYVNKHGGEIWAESSPGKGSVFYFTVPLTEDR
jgi:PAS domain S-box-containing protein